MAKFLIINGSNPKNIGIIRDYSETFESPDVMKLTEEQVNEWNTISPMERTFRLNEYRATNDKKKIFQVVEGVTKPVEKESVETFVDKNYIMPETEIDEPFNEPVNEVEETQEVLNEVAQDLPKITGEKIELKTKRAYNKKVK